MADIHLMRHGAYAGHQPGHHAPPDAPLSKEGRTQIRDALPLPAHITAIATSPLLRARQTADLLSHLTGLPIIAITPLLAEWKAPSIVLGHVPETYPHEYLTWRKQRTTNPSLACQDGESLADLTRRAHHCSRYLTYTVENHRGAIVAVSHKILLGVLTRLGEGPHAFDESAHSPWQFAELKPFNEPSQRTNESAK